MHEIRTEIEIEATPARVWSVLTEHYFELMPSGHEHTRLVHGEKFSGLMVFMAKSSLEGGTRAGFNAMNKALKARAEAHL